MHYDKQNNAAHRANHVFDTVPVLEVLVHECREGKELSRAGIKVEVVFLCVEAGLFGLPPGGGSCEKQAGFFGRLFSARFLAAGWPR